MAGFCDSLHTILSVVLQFSLTFYLFSVVKSIGIFQSVLIRLLFTPCPATRCAMHRIYANRINSCDMSRVFCDLRSQKTPRGTLPVNSNHRSTLLRKSVIHGKGSGKNIGSFRHLSNKACLPHLPFSGHLRNRQTYRNYVCTDLHS